MFYTLAASSLFILLYAPHIRQRSRLFCAFAGIALIVALPVSISRSLLAGYLMVLTATLAALILSRTRVVPLLTGASAVALAVALATTIPAFQDTSTAFLARWDAAAGTDRESVGDVGVASYQFQNRIISGFNNPLSNLDSVPLAGYGIGIGTNVGSQRLTGDLEFLVGEGAWEAALAELGLPLGLAFIFWRVSLALMLLNLSFLQSVRGNTLPLILFGSSSFDLLIGQVSQPTALGFLVISSGITLAACNSGPPISSFVLK